MDRGDLVVGHADELAVVGDHPGGEHDILDVACAFASEVGDLPDEFLGFGLFENGFGFLFEWLRQGVFAHDTRAFTAVAGSESAPA